MSYNKKLVHSFLVKIRTSQPSKVMFAVLGMTNYHVNLKRMHPCFMTDNTRLFKDLVNVNE